MKVTAASKKTCGFLKTIRLLMDIIFGILLNNCFKITCFEMSFRKSLTFMLNESELLSNVLLSGNYFGT
jgi:hypothetical protein